MTVPKVILTNRLLVPIKLIDAEDVKQAYDKRVYDLKNCARCPYNHEKHSEHCDPCESYKGHFVTYKKVVYREKTYWSLPRAELYNLKNLGLPKVKVVNRMTKGVALDNRLEIIRSPYEYQEKCITELVEGDGRKNYYPHGILKAAPRSGKCVVGDTLIMTDKGFLPIEKFFPADYQDEEVTEFVAKINSLEPNESTSLKYKKTVDKTISLTTESGFEIAGTPNHPVLIKSALDNRWEKLQNVNVGDSVCVQLNAAVFSSTDAEIPRAPIQYKTTIRPRLARLLGLITRHYAYWHQGFAVMSHDKEVQEEFQRLFLILFSASLHFDDRGIAEVTTPSVVAFLRSCQCDHTLPRNATFSELVMRSTKESICEFMRGYLFANVSIRSQHIAFVSKTQARYVQTFFAAYGIVLKIKDTQFANVTIYETDPQEEDSDKLLKFMLGDNTFSSEESIRVHEKVVARTEDEVARDVYDLTVPGSHSFIANGLVVHNTLMSLVASVRLGRKVLILANQEDLLKQFIIELDQTTNIKDIDKFDGKVSYGICTKMEHFDQYQICLATYQSFISAKGKQKLKKIRRLFGTVFVDEAHRCAADAFSKVIDSFWAENRFGLTATDKRKDRLDFVTRQIIGDVVTEAKVDSLIPKVVVIPTHIKPKYQYSTWNGAMQFLANSKDRIELIMRWIRKDLKAGRKIVIPVAYKKQVHDIVKRVRDMGYTAEAFIGGMKREQLLEQARAGKIDVVVGIRSILATGVNVPCWSVIYTIAPISNAPNYYQETTRICTPLEGKPQPLIRIFVDDMPMTKGCFRTCWTGTFIPMKYKIGAQSRDTAREILSNMKGGYVDEDSMEGSSSYDPFSLDGGKTREAKVFDHKKGKTVSKQVKVRAKPQLQSLKLFG